MFSDIIELILIAFINIILRALVAIFLSCIMSDSFSSSTRDDFLRKLSACTNKRYIQNQLRQNMNQECGKCYYGSVRLATLPQMFCIRSYLV